jgi:hypothetical protein
VSARGRRLSRTPSRAVLPGEGRTPVRPARSGLEPRLAPEPLSRPQHPHHVRSVRCPGALFGVKVTVSRSSRTTRTRIPLSPSAGRVLDQGSAHRVFTAQALDRDQTEHRIQPRILPAVEAGSRGPAPATSAGYRLSSTATSGSAVRASPSTRVRAAGSSPGATRRFERADAPVALGVRGQDAQPPPRALLRALLLREHGQAHHGAGVTVDTPVGVLGRAGGAAAPEPVPRSGHNTSIHSIYTHCV